VLLPAASAARWLSRAARLESEIVLADSAALSAWAGSASFPPEVCIVQPSASSEPPFLADVLPATRNVQRRASADAPQSWRGGPGSHQVLDIDPQWLRCVRVRLRTDAPHGGRPRLAWVSDEGLPSASAEGVWLAGADGPVALFDLAREPRWLLCGRVRSITLEGGEPDPAYEVLPALPEPALASGLNESAGRWSARPAASALPGLRWQLVLFDPRTLESARLEARGELEFETPAGWSGRAHLEWSLEALLGERCVARLAGKR
jgi:hypothetical protein